MKIVTLPVSYAAVESHNLPQIHMVQRVRSEKFLLSLNSGYASDLRCNLGKVISPLNALLFHAKIELIITKARSEHSLSFPYYNLEGSVVWVFCYCDTQSVQISSVKKCLRLDMCKSCLSLSLRN